jgi:glycosyltransferase involved in cell wall biosynthesis
MAAPDLDQQIGRQCEGGFLKKDAALPELSVVIPLRNEVTNVEPLVEAIAAALAGSVSYEVIAVDDGSDDGTWEALVGLRERTYPTAARMHSSLCCFRLQRCSGMDAAMEFGFAQARGRILVTMDGDLQNCPSDVPGLLDALRGYDMVCGIRTPRRDRAAVVACSRVANLARNLLTGDRISDAGCNLRVFRRECLGILLLHSGRLLGQAHYFYPSLLRLHGYRVVVIYIQ